MRILQFDSVYPRYLDSFYGQIGNVSQLTYDALHRRIIDDRFNATHILEPVLKFEKDVLYVPSSDAISQSRWAEEKGLKTRDLREILLAQIEDHRTEVLYAMDLHIIGEGFVRRLPGCVKKTIGYHSGPGTAFDFSAFDLCLSNYPVYVRRWKRAGLRAAHFSPSHDPVMADYACNEDRPIDIVFAGSCGAYHQQREALLNEMASLAKRYRLHFALVHPRFRPWLDLPLVRRLPSPIPYLLKPLREVAKPPVFGRSLYELFSRAKIVLNVATDISGVHRVNMRCFEATGCGACMLSDEGVYPDGLRDGEHFVSYENSAEALAIAQDLLAKPNDARTIGRKAATMLASTYSKSTQWDRFQQLAGSC